jgi:hypothetical protein
VLDLFDADIIEVSTLLNGSTGKRGVYALPMGRTSNHVHVWVSLLERAGLSLDAIPKEWEASFWCDQVQPAVREALGREDIWGIGLPMSAESIDTDDEFLQFQLAYGTPWLDLERPPQFDRPQVRAGIIEALNAYTLISRKGCTPPASVNRAAIDNNKAFLEQTVVMTANTTLSIPGALKGARPDLRGALAASSGRRIRVRLGLCRVSRHRILAGRRPAAAQHGNGADRRDRGDVLRSPVKDRRSARSLARWKSSSGSSPGPTMSLKRSVIKARSNWHVLTFSGAQSLASSARAWRKTPCSAGTPLNPRGDGSPANAIREGWRSTARGSALMRGDQVALAFAPSGTGRSAGRG